MVFTRLRHYLAGSPQPSAESGSLSYGLPVHLRMLSTPPHGDAVSFDYGGATNSGTDSHRSVKASSRTHSSPRRRGSITTDVNRGSDRGPASRAVCIGGCWFRLHA